MTRLAVVSGGGTGIGRATAGMLAGEGYDVIIVGRRSDVLADAVKWIGPQASAVTADVGAGSDYQPVQPGVKSLDVAKRRQIAPCPHQCLLGRILGEFGIAEDETGDRVQPIDGAGGQDTEGLAVSASRPVDELRLHASLLSRATDLVAYTLWRGATVAGSFFAERMSFGRHRGSVRANHASHGYKCHGRGVAPCPNRAG